MTDTYQEIVVDWEPKQPINSMEDFVAITDNIQSKNVLYQIYGDHHIYGRDVLLYIGISRDIRSRIDAHLKGVFQFVNNKSVSLGFVEEELDLEIPESILIANHKPAFSKEYIHAIDPKAMSHKILIINNGDNGMLKTCCTNYWWVA